MKSCARCLAYGCAVVGFVLTAAISTGQEQALSNLTFVAFDIETTGLSRTRDRIVEIGAVKFRNGRELERRTWLVNPLVPIPQEAFAIHGISDSLVARAPLFPEVYVEFRAFIGDCVLLAHNASFDTGFMVAELERAGETPPTNSVLDTLALARKWYPEAPRHGLAALTDYLALGAAPTHRGLDDARRVMDLFLKGVGNLPPGTGLAQLKQTAGLRFSRAPERTDLVPKPR